MRLTRRAAWNALGATLLALTGASTVLVGAELALRWWNPSPAWPNVTEIGRRKILDALPGIRYLYPAYASYSQSWPSNPRGYFDPATNGISYRLNNYGFRDDDFSLRRNARLRIAFLGDSFCWGIGVKRADRLSALIENELNREAVLGRGYEVYDFCMPGFNTDSEAALYERVVRYFQPDVLVLWFFLNDVNLPPDLYFPIKPPWRNSSHNRSGRSRFRLLAWAETRLGLTHASREFIRSVNRAYRPGHPGWASVQAGFERIRKVSQETAVPTFVAMFPWLYDLDSGNYPFAEPHRAVQALAREKGFEVLDLLGVFAGRDARTLWVHPRDQHPNEIGHRVAARAMLSFLVPRLELLGDRLLRAAERRAAAPVPPILARSRVPDWYRPFDEFPEPAATARVETSPGLDATRTSARTGAAHPSRPGAHGSTSATSSSGRVSGADRAQSGAGSTPKASGAS